MTLKKYCRGCGFSNDPKKSIDMDNFFGNDPKKSIDMAADIPMTLKKL
jgi:hypothetical protein